MVPVPFIRPLQVVCAFMDDAVWLMIFVVQPVAPWSICGGLLESTSAWLMHSWPLEVWAVGAFMPMAFICAIASGGMAIAMLVVVTVFQRPALPWPANAAPGARIKAAAARPEMCLRSMHVPICDRPNLACEPPA